MRQSLGTNCAESAEILSDTCHGPELPKEVGVYRPVYSHLFGQYGPVWPKEVGVYRPIYSHPVWAIWTQLAGGSWQVAGGRWQLGGGS